MARANRRALISIGELSGPSEAEAMGGATLMGESWGVN